MSYVEVLGVHRLSITDDLIKRQDAVLSGLDEDDPDHVVSSDQTELQLRSVVLVELRVVDRDDSFDVADFAQEEPGEPRQNWQAAWAEAYLTADGSALAQERVSLAAPPEGDIRMAFFMHSWKTDIPLETSYGRVACPTPQPMPDRLAALVPFVTVG